MQKTAGYVLKEKREEKNITLQTAAEHTKITRRHLESLEEDNYSVFPGETYAQGFLRRYASYLDLDPEHILQLYRGAQLVEREVPIQELTEPTVTTSDKIKPYIKYVAILAAIALGVLVYTNFDSSKNTVNSGNDQNNSGFESILKNSERIPSVETDHVTLRSGFTTAMIPTGTGIDFSIQNTEVYLVLKKINYKTRPDNTSSAVVEVYPGREEKLLIENKPVLMQIKDVAREFRVTMQGATPNNIKVKIDLGEATEADINSTVETDTGENQATGIANPNNFIIVLQAELTNDNYVEFYVDGKPRKKGLLSKGSIIRYEANDSIQMKIGDAGAINLTVNGKQYDLGNRGTQVHKIFRKVKDPVEQTKFNIVVKDM